MIIIFLKRSIFRISTYLEPTELIYLYIKFKGKYNINPVTESRLNEPVLELFLTKKLLDYFDLIGRYFVYNRES